MKKPSLFFCKAFQTVEVGNGWERETSNVTVGLFVLENDLQPVSCYCFKPNGRINTRTVVTAEAALHIYPEANLQVTTGAPG